MFSSLERKFGRFAIPNLTLIFIVGQVAMFLLCKQQPQNWERIVLIPSKVLDGEIYRLISFLVLPPGDAILWALLAWYVFYLMGTALENYWGTFRYNVFILIGYLATTGAAFITPELPIGNAFLTGSVFLAFAYLNPDFQLMLAFVFPVKIKWLALFVWIGIVLQIIFAEWHQKISAVAGVLNFFAFFGVEVFNRARFGQKFMASQAKRFSHKPEPYMHKCETCGLTDADDAKMDFRYCSQCSGDLCYCSDHLRNHEHVWNTTADEA